MACLLHTWGLCGLSVLNIDAFYAPFNYSEYPEAERNSRKDVAFQTHSNTDGFNKYQCQTK